jgi:DNA-binding NarL/FixJ family response regulator
MTPVRIVLADDHALVRAGISRALAEMPGYEIIAEASDGPSVEAALARSQPDLLLIDVAMPEFEPLAAIKAIRDDYPQMRILVISAHDDSVYVRGLLAAGVDGYHLKDQSLSELQLAVERVMGGQRWVTGRLLDRLATVSDAPSTSTDALSSRRRDIVSLLLAGSDNQTIAHRMGLSVKTVEKHLTAIYRQLGVQSRLGLVSYISQHPDTLGPQGRRVDANHPAEPSKERPVSILLVDDNLRYRHRLRKILDRIRPGATVDEAGSVEETIELLRTISPDLAVVDVVLGDENGIECTRQIKARSPRTRVVLISAYRDRAFRDQGLQAGAVALLDKKDLDVASLRLVVDDLDD